MVLKGQGGRFGIRLSKEYAFLSCGNGYSETEWMEDVDSGYKYTGTRVEDKCKSVSH